MSSIPCNIVLLPDNELSQKAIAASQLLANHDSFFTLEMGKFYPHLSLYMFQLNEEDVQRVKEILAKIAGNFRVVVAKAATYRLGEGFGVGYIDLEYEVSEELRSLQQQIIDAVNPIRAGMRESDKAKIQDATGIKLENLQKYGYPAVGKLFRPHITLTRLKKHKAEVLKLLPDVHTFNRSFVKLGLFEMGTNGTCVRQIQTVNLLASGATLLTLPGKSDKVQDSSRLYD